MDDDLELLEELDLMYESGRDAEDIGAISLSSDSDSEDLERTREADEGRRDEDAPDGGLNAPDGSGLGVEQVQGLRATIIEITSALGGLEEVMNDAGEIQMAYQIGDDCLRCLRDLRTLWRQDEMDATRLIPRLFSELNVLRSGLLPLLLKTSGTGERGDKIALACTDLITSITWPVDTMAELRDAIDIGDETAQDNIAHTLEIERVLVTYKSSILRVRLEETYDGQTTSNRDVLTCVLRDVLLPAVSKGRHSRSDRDNGTISMCLHLFRNLLAIRDPQATALSSADMLATATLQSQLICAMDKSKILETIYFLASSAETPDYEPWNAVAAECIYYMICGTDPRTLARTDLATAAKSSLTAQPASVSDKPQSSLSSLLDAESRQKRKDVAKNGASRHSRFNSVITFTDSNGTKQVTRKQSAIRKSIAELRDNASAKLEAKKRRGGKRKAPMQERGAPRIKAEWTPQARAIMRVWADQFLKGDHHAFEVLVRSILKDIRSEREKMGDLDEARIRIMYMARFFLEYFVQRREETVRLAKQRAVLAQHNAADTKAFVEAAESEWGSDIVGEWLQPWAFKMVKVRTVESGDAKNWLEYTTAIQLWTVLLHLVDMLSRSTKENESEVADNLQAQLYYQEDTLRVCKLITASYKSQSFACMEAIISFAYNMPRLLERYSSDKENLYVLAKNRKKKAVAGDDDLIDNPRANAEFTLKERRFTFQTFQTRLASSQLTDACVRYLQRWTEFTRPKEQLTMVVGVMHRIAVKAQNYRSFFPAPHRTYFRALLNSSIFIKLSSEASTASGDLEKLLKFILKKFDKQSVEEQAKWAGLARPRVAAKGPKVPAEIKAKAGIPLGDQFGVAIGLLLEKGKMSYVQWVRGALEQASARRTAIIEEELLGRRIERRQKKAERLEVDVDTLDLTDSEDDRHDEETIGKFVAHELPYDMDEDLKRDASVMPELKMLCRLAGLESHEADPLAFKWHIAARVLPEHLDDDIETIDKFIREPFETDGLELSAFVEKVRKPRAPRAPRNKDLDPDHGDMHHFLEPDSDEAPLSDTDAEDDRPIPKKAPRRRPNPAEDELSPDSLSDTDEERPIARRARLLQEAGEGDVAAPVAPKRKKARPPQAGNPKPRKERVKRSGKSAVPRKKVYRPPGAPARPKATPWTSNDFIEDSEEELAIVDRLLKERIAAKAADLGAGDEELSDADVRTSGENPSRRVNQDDDEERDELDDDPNDVPPPVPRSRMRARKRARRAAALSGASSSPNRIDSESTTPPTSSPPVRGAEDAASKAKASSKVAGSGLFRGEELDDELDEIDELMDEDEGAPMAPADRRLIIPSGLRTRLGEGDSPSLSPTRATRGLIVPSPLRRAPSMSPTTALLRGGQQSDEEDDELVSPVRPRVSSSRKRPLAIDSDADNDEDELDQEEPAGRIATSRLNSRPVVEDDEIMSG